LQDRQVPERDSGMDAVGQRSTLRPCGHPAHRAGVTPVLRSRTNLKPQGGQSSTSLLRGRQCVAITMDCGPHTRPRDFRHATARHRRGRV